MNEQKIRKSNIRVISMKGSVKKGLKEVEKQNLRYAVILGENELELINDNKIVVKDMKLHKQECIDLETFINSQSNKQNSCYCLFLEFQKQRYICNYHKKMSETLSAPVGYKKFTENCTLPEKIVSKKSNEIWLIHAPKDVFCFNSMNNTQFPELALEKINMDLSKGNCTAFISILTSSCFRVYSRRKEVYYERRR